MLTVFKSLVRMIEKVVAWKRARKYSTTFWNIAHTFISLPRRQVSAAPYFGTLPM